MIKGAKIIYAFLVVAFLLGPLTVILPLAFNDSILLSYPMRGLSTRWFQELVINDIWREAVINTLYIGAATSLLATFLGTLASLGLRGKVGFGFRTVRVMFLLPIVAPVVVLGVGMQIVMAPMGLTNSFLGVVIAHTVIALPFVVISVSTSLGGIDQEVERAAASLGASPAAVLRSVTLPLAMPGIQAGAVFAFATSLDEVVLNIFLGGPEQRTLAREMFSQLRMSITPVIAAIAFVFIVATYLIAAGMIVWRSRREALPGV